MNPQHDLDNLLQMKFFKNDRVSLDFTRGIG